MDEALMAFFPGRRFEQEELVLLRAKWKKIVPRIRGTPHECARRAARRFLRFEVPRVLQSRETKITTMIAARRARIKVQMARLFEEMTRERTRCHKFQEAAQALVSSSSSEEYDEPSDDESSSSVDDHSV
jgi:hypothetical protein